MNPAVAVFLCATAFFVLLALLAMRGVKKDPSSKNAPLLRGVAGAAAICGAITAGAALLYWGADQAPRCGELRKYVGAVDDAGRVVLFSSKGLPAPDGRYLFMRPEDGRPWQGRTSIVRQEDEQRFMRCETNPDGVFRYSSSDFEVRGGVVVKRGVDSETLRALPYR